MGQASVSQHDRRNVSQRVAEELRHALAEGRNYPHGQLPSHRELCRQHRVSINTLRKALDILEHEGVLYRLERGGTFLSTKLPPTRAHHAAAPLKCINFLEQYPAMWSWLKTDYLAGYTDALDHVDVKMRFVPCPKDITDYSGLILDRFGANEQGCVLVNVAPPRVLEWLAAQHVPVVVQYFTYYERNGLPAHHSVYVNKAGAGAEAVRHLVELGHRRIGYAGPLHAGQGVAGLYEGYRAALQCAGLDQGPIEVVADVNTDDVAVAVGYADEYLRRPHRHLCRNGRGGHRHSQDRQGDGDQGAGGVERRGIQRPAGGRPERSSADHFRGAYMRTSYEDNMWRSGFGVGPFWGTNALRGSPWNGSHLLAGIEEFLLRATPETSPRYDCLLNKARDLVRQLLVLVKTECNGFHRATGSFLPRRHFLVAYLAQDAELMQAIVEAVRAIEAEYARSGEAFYKTGHHCGGYLESPYLFRALFGKPLPWRVR